ncbi:MAG TPA: zinc transporter ZupT, partial [Bacteroidales bacterium]|nr:zinc transporter ZupT [Bacteroidales bacterium]
GSVMALFSKQFNPKFLALSLGFSAGVMIYVAFVEIFSKARHALTESFGNEVVLGLNKAYLLTVVSFFAGIAIIALIDKFVPSAENPHEIKSLENTQNVKDKKLMRLGIFSALAIGIHNFPEGLATFIAALQDPTLGISIAFAIAIHNIPEGIAVSVPIYYATKNKKRAFTLSFLSGLAEPIGAIIGYLLLRTVLDQSVLGYVFASVAGIMVYISIDELLPTAEEYGEHHIAIWGLIAGMFTMAMSLVLFA